MDHAARLPLASGTLLPLLLLTGLLGIVALQSGVFNAPASGAAAEAPETVTIAPRPYAYRASGDFLKGGASVDGPLVQVDRPEPLEIMKYQVSATDYGRCVAEGACRKAEPRLAGRGKVPATGVSYEDATTYAAWLSGRTGDNWRLPTVGEWAFAAGSKAVDHALGRETDASNPAERWIAFYEKEAARKSNELATPEPLGSFGVNEYGVADLAAVVWEWTSTCAGRTTLDGAGAVVTQVQSCGVRFLEGRHRTPMSIFVRDAVGGGCSVGVPPDNLGFRLVRERAWWKQLAGRLLPA